MSFGVEITNHQGWYSDAIRIMGHEAWYKNDCWQLVINFLNVPFLIEYQTHEQFITCVYTYKAFFPEACIPDDPQDPTQTKVRAVEA